MGEPADPPLAGVRGVVFDLDGTLVDSYAAIAASVNAARARFGLDPLGEPDVRRRVGRGLESLMSDVVGPADAAEGVRIFRAHYATVFAEGTAALPGAIETVGALHERGYRLSVASNKIARFGRPILERLGMARFLSAVEGPDTSGATKPDPAMIARCLSAMAVRREAALYVGDMVLDVETASRAGVRVLLVPGGSSTPAELAGTEVPVLASLRDVLRLLPGPAAPAEEAPFRR